MAQARGQAMAQIFNYLIAEQNVSVGQEANRFWQRDCEVVSRDVGLCSVPQRRWT